MSAFLLSVAMATSDPIHPWKLPLGTPGLLQVSPGIQDTRSGRSVSSDEIAARLDGRRFVLIGEAHDNTDHKVFTADLIRALVRRGRSVEVGLEMFTRPNQPNLAPWSLGRWSEQEFIERSNWRTEWGFDFQIYRPMFEAVRESKLPLVALNVPRDWVRQVGRGGPGALSEEARRQVPAFDASNEDHRKLFTAMIGGHPMANEERMNNMIAAQVLWDVGMADTALKWAAKNPPNRIMVILAGSGHAAYGLGINLRIKELSGQSVPTVICLSPEDKEVSRGIGDWIFQASSKNPV